MGRDATILLGMRIFGTLFWMVFIIVLARALPQENFATALYVINFSLVAVLVITGGRDSALLRLVSQAWSSGARLYARNMLVESRRTVFFAGLLLTAVLLSLAAVGLDTPVTASPIIALLAGMISMASAQIALNRNTLRSVGKVWQSQLGTDFIRTVVPTVVTVVLYLTFEMNVVLALFLYFVSLSLAFLVEQSILRGLDWQDTPDANQPDYINFARIGLQIWPGDIANAVQMRSAGLIAGLVFAPEIAAMFIAAERFANLAQFPIAAAIQAVGPRIAQSSCLGLDDAQRVLRSAALLMLIAGVVGCLGAAALAWPGLWALGPDYLAALPITLILIGAHLSWAFFGSGQSALILTGNHQAYRNVAVIYAILGTVVMGYVGINYGPIAMAWAYCGIWWMTNLSFVVALYKINRLQTGLFAIRHGRIQALFTQQNRDRGQR